MIFSERPEDFKPWFEVAACLCECNGQILLLKRLEEKSEGGRWGAPGGKIDQGETVEEAVIREVKEETGILLQTAQMHLLRTYLVRAGEKDIVYHLHRAIFAQLPQVTLNPGEHTESRWVTVDTALTLPLVHDMDECLRDVYQR